MPEYFFKHSITATASLLPEEFPEHSNAHHIQAQQSNSTSNVLNDHDSERILMLRAHAETSTHNHNFLQPQRSALLMFLFVFTVWVTVEWGQRAVKGVV